MTKISDLPEKLVKKSLSKVPVASLRWVRSTCKKWNDLSKGRSFGGKSSNNKEFVGFMMKDFRVCSLRFDLQGIRNEGVLVDPSIKQVSMLNQVEISKIFHCDGLLLCVTKDNSSLLVWNPYLGQTKWIKPRTSFHRFDVYALGYGDNNSNRNHKILRSVDHDISVEYEIYDFSSNLWRLLHVTPDWEISFYQRSATLKGNAYFFAKQRLVVPEGLGDDEPIDTTETEDFLLCFDFTAERFGPRLPLPFHSYIDETVTLSCVRDEKLAALLQTWDGSRVMEVWVTNNIDPNAVSWSMFLKVDMSPLTGFTFLFQAASFFIDEEKKVVVVFDLDGRKLTMTRYQTAYIIGQDGYFNSVNIGEATTIPKPNLCGVSFPIYCVPLVCSSSYVPSLVQLQINNKPLERPLELSSNTSPLLHPEGEWWIYPEDEWIDPKEEWIESLDEASGHMYYYNTKTHVLQFEPPSPATTNSNNAVTQNTADEKREHPPSQLPKCRGCGGWGVGLIQSWGYCSHCTRVFNLPEQQYLAASSNYLTNTGDSSQKDPNQRSMGKESGNKRAHAEDDKLNPSSDDPRSRRRL